MFEFKVVTKKNGKPKTDNVNGFTNDPAKDLSRYKRKELEEAFDCDKNSPIMVIVK